MADESYSTIREIIGKAIGARLVEITQHDQEEFKETGQSYVALHFDNGVSLTFYTDGDGDEFLCYSDISEDDDGE